MDKKKILTILSTSHSLPEDIKKYGIIGDVMVVNHQIADYIGDIKYAVSLHHDCLADWMAKRKAAGLNTEGVTLFNDRHTCPVPLNTSGLLALWESQRLPEYDEVRVLGLSADNRGHYYDVGQEYYDNFEARFPFDNDDWLPILKSWTNIRVASGNLLRLYPQIDSNKENNNV